VTAPLLEVFVIARLVFPRHHPGCLNSFQDLLNCLDGREWKRTPIFLDEDSLKLLVKTASL
jgi:hypothetical protein